MNARLGSYPELWASLPSTLRMRVVLWHSAVIYAITTKREACIRNVHMAEDSGGLQFNFDGVGDIINAQVTRILWDIYEDLKEEDLQYLVER